MKNYLSGIILFVTIFGGSLIAQSATEAGDYRISIELSADEYWWGGVVVDGSAMPFGKNPYAHDLLGNNKGNQSQPLLISNQGRYVWCEDPFRFEFSGNQLTASSQFSQIFSGKTGNTLKDAFLSVSKQYFPPAGKLPDELLFSAPQYNTWIELMYDQNEADILTYAQAIIDNGFPPGVLMIDDNWQEDYGTWEFKAEKFSNPREMIRRLHDMGFKVMLWVCPFVSPDSPVYREISEKGYLLRENTDAGEPAMIRWWNGVSAVIDFTNPEAEMWFHQQLQFLIEKYAVDGFKLDGGDDYFYVGDYRSFEQTHANGHMEMYARVGLRYPLNEFRACWKLAGQPLAQRLRDKAHDWQDLQKLIPDILTQGLVGYAFSCPDMIGGGEFGSFLSTTTIDQELVVRSSQCHALMPMMQFSVAPWRILSPENLAICRKMADLHEQFAATILQLANESAHTGEPIVRHMEYVFPHQGYANIKDQFMLGDSILVAPVLAQGAVTKTIHFPAGNWQGDDGSVVKGPKIAVVNAPIERLPWYRRLK
ncbi:MAG: alpha-galactosidase [Calditrichae bacterium]|nr:alpha-galactosidase [Calditrichia bacterium]